MPDNPGLYLFRDLEQRDPTLLMPRRAETPFEAGVDVPTKTDLAPGSYEFVKTVINDVGSAKVLADGAFDFPVVDASASEDRYRVLMCVAGFTVGFQSERRQAYASAAGTLRAREYDTKIRACVRAIQEKRDRIAAYGDAQAGVTGLLNNANVTPDNNSFNPYSTTTASDLADFFINLVKTFDNNSGTVFTPSTALVSIPLNYRMMTLRMPDSGISVKDHVTKTLSDEGIKFEIRKRRQCNSANLEANGVQVGGTNKDRIVLYRLDPEIVERHVEMIQMAPPEYTQVSGLNRLYPMFGCTSPTIVNYTTAISYTDVVKGT